MRRYHLTRSGGTAASLVFLAAFTVLGLALNTPFSIFSNNSTTPPRYVVIDLGTNFVPIGINNAGLIAGNTTNSSEGDFVGSGNPEVWSQGNLTTLPITSLGAARANGLDSAGAIYGSAYFSYPAPSSHSGAPTSLVEQHACYWPSTNSTPVDLDSQHNTASVHNVWYFNPYYFGGQYYSQYSSFAQGGNANGIYGIVNSYTTFYAAQFSTNAVPAPVVPGENLDGTGYGEGPPGVVTSVTANHWCGYTYAEYSWIIDGQTNSIYGLGGPTGINTNGVAVADQYTNSMAQPITIQSGSGAITNLPGTGYPSAINNYATISTNTPPVTNNAPQIVGTDSTSVNATLWDQTYYDGTPTTNSVYVQKNLTAMIAQPTSSSSQAPASWTVTSAVGINDSGAIVGTAKYTQIPYAPVQHGVMLIPDSIQRDGNSISGTNANVWVGQQICLTNVVSGVPTNSISSYQWSIPGANNTTNDTAFYDYEPNATNSCYTNLFTPTNYTTNNYCNFYWSAGGTNQVTCTTVIYGRTNTVTATLNVQRPSATISALNGVIAVDSGNWIFGHTPTSLHFGSVEVGALPGMTFGETISGIPSGFISTNVWNQIINSDPITRTTSSSSVTTNSFGYDGSYAWEYPYTTGEEADDSPGGDLLTNQISVTRYFNATMYLMWQAAPASVNGDKTVVVPLQSYTWYWGGTATNGAPTAGWGLQSSNYPSSSIASINVTNEPTWSTNSAYNHFSVP